MKGPGRVPVLLAAILAVSWWIPASALAQGGTVERPFAPGGQVRMDLSAADYTIQAGRDDRILIRWETRSTDDASRIRADVTTQGSAATIVTHGPHNNVRFVIEIPARTGLHVDLSAGDLKVRGIEGNKDLGSWAGNIDVDVGHANDYASVDAAVKAGNLSASAFKVYKEGLFRSFTWKGPGRYTLRVRLTAGDLRLYDTQGSSSTAR